MKKVLLSTETEMNSEFANPFPGGTPHLDFCKQQVQSPAGNGFANSVTQSSKEGQFVGRSESWQEPQAKPCVVGGCARRAVAWPFRRCAVCLCARRNRRAVGDQLTVPQSSKEGQLAGVRVGESHRPSRVWWAGALEAPSHGRSGAVPCVSVLVETVAARRAAGEQKPPIKWTSP